MEYWIGDVKSDEAIKTAGDLNKRSREQGGNVRYFVGEPKTPGEGMAGVYEAHKQ